jgi:hypothetical protein
MNCSPPWLSALSCQWWYCNDLSLELYSKLKHSLDPGSHTQVLRRKRSSGELVRQVASYRRYRQANRTALFAFRDREDIGGPMITRVAKQFG